MKTKNDCFSVIRHPLKEGRRMRNSDKCNLSYGTKHESKKLGPFTGARPVTVFNPSINPKYEYG